MARMPEVDNLQASLNQARGLAGRRSAARGECHATRAPSQEATPEVAATAATAAPTAAAAAAATTTATTSQRPNPSQGGQRGQEQQQQQPLQDDLTGAERPAREAHRTRYELPDPMQAAEWDVDNLCFFCGGGHRATMCPNFLDRASGGLHEVARSRRRVNEFLRTFKPLKAQVHERRLVQQHGQGQPQATGSGAPESGSGSAPGSGSASSSGAATGARARRRPRRS
jgi:hypothetical protein